MRELLSVLVMTLLLVGTSAASDVPRASDGTRSYDLITTQVADNKTSLLAAPVQGSAVREILDRGDVVTVLSFSEPYYWFVAHEGLAGYVLYIHLEESEKMQEIRGGHSGTGYEHLTLEQLGVYEGYHPGADRQAAPLRFDLRRGTHGGGGYSCQIPNEWVGICVFITRGNGFGGYFDVRGTWAPVSSLGSFRDDVTVSDAQGWGDTLENERTDWSSVSIGTTRVLSRLFAVYAGIGYSSRTDYREYYDSLHTSDNDGRYWVESDQRGYFNGLGGIILVSDKSWGVFKNWALLIGGQLHPAGVTAAFAFVG